MPSDWTRRSLLFQDPDSWEMFLAILRLIRIFICLIVTIRKRTRLCQVAFYEMPMNSDAEIFDPKHSAMILWWMVWEWRCIIQDYYQVTDLSPWNVTTLHIEISVNPVQSPTMLHLLRIITKRIAVNKRTRWAPEIFGNQGHFPSTVSLFKAIIRPDALSVVFVFVFFLSWIRNLIFIFFQTWTHVYLLYLFSLTPSNYCPDALINLFIYSFFFLALILF